MDAIKPDQERVKNLLLDTVTLLCKNSLQFENYLRVEGLLGVAVDDKDTFFLHISERFQSDAYIERQKQEREEKEAEARREQEEKEEAERAAELAAERASEEAESASQNASEALAIKVKTEARDQEDDDDDDLVITGSSSLNSPQTVARSATMVAGQRRAQRRAHSPSSSSVHNQSDSANYHTQQSSPFVQQSDSEDGDGSYSQYDNNQSIKTEQWDGPPAKRQAMSNPWPNVSLGDLSMQAAQATFSDSGDGSFAGGGGDPSEPGCSAWPTNLQLQQSGSQDSAGGIQYAVCPAGSKKGKDVMYDSQGYSYLQKSGKTSWRCRRYLVYKCKAKVLQRGLAYTSGSIAHNHPADETIPGEVMALLNMGHNSQLDSREFRNESNQLDNTQYNPGYIHMEPNEYDNGQYNVK